MYIYILSAPTRKCTGGIGKFDSWYKNLNYSTKQRNEGIEERCAQVGRIRTEKKAEERRRERIKRFYEHTREPKLNGCVRA